VKAIPSLLADPTLNPNIKDNNNETPLGIISCTDSASLIHCLFQHKNFDPLVVDSENIPPLYVAHFLIQQAPFVHAGLSTDKGVKINIGKFMNKTIMTKQLQLIPHITGEGFFGGWDNVFSWTFLDLLIKFCIETCGSLTERDESGYLPVDVTRRQYKNHHEEEVEYCNKTAETIRKEMTYHLYLLNTPNRHTSCYKLYFYVKDSFTRNKDTNNKIMQFYYQLTIDTNIDREIALRVEKYYKNYKEERKKSPYNNEYYRNNKLGKTAYRENIKKQLAITY